MLGNWPFTKRSNWSTGNCWAFHANSNAVIPISSLIILVTPLGCLSILSHVSVMTTVTTLYYRRVVVSHHGYSVWSFLWWRRCVDLQRVGGTVEGPASNKIRKEFSPTWWLYSFIWQALGWLFTWSGDDSQKIETLLQTGDKCLLLYSLLFHDEFFFAFNSSLYNLTSTSFFCSLSLSLSFLFILYQITK